MYISTDTVFYQRLMINKLMGLSTTPEKGTTLNEKFDTGDGFISGDPIINLITLGIKPDNFFDDNKMNLLDLKHPATDGTVYKPLPFFMHREDASSVTIPNNRYRLRSKVIINGIKYIAYYGLNLYGFDIVPKNYRLVRNPDDNTYGLFEFDISDINVLNPINDVVDNYAKFKPNDYITVMTNIDVKFDTDILLGIIDAAEIMYPDLEKVIGEIGICTSIDDGSEANSAQTAFLTSPMVLLQDKLSSTGEYVFSIPLGGIAMNISRQ